MTCGPTVCSRRYWRRSSPRPSAPKNRPTASLSDSLPSSIVRRLLPMVLALAVDAFALSILPADALPRPLLLVAAALALIWAGLQPRGDDLLPALAVLIAGIGLMEVTRLSPDLGRRQEIGMVVSLAIVVMLRPIVEHYHRWAQLKYLWVLLSIALFAVVEIAGTEVNGAKLWLRFAGISFQPVELI